MASNRNLLRHFVPSADRRRRPPRRFQPAPIVSGVEVLERRDVPAAVIYGPTVFNNSPNVSATINQVGNQIQAVFTLSPNAPAGYSTPVGLALYSLPHPGDPFLPQTRLMNIQGAFPVSAAHPVVTITVNIPFSGDDHCVQADAYYGDASTAGPYLIHDSGGYNDKLNAGLLAALITCDNDHDKYTGLTAGYYKNHLGAFAALGINPNQTIGETFGAYGDFAPGSPYASLANDTLVDALDYKGGSTLLDKAHILLRQAVTGLLNASFPAINYQLTGVQLNFMVHTALYTAGVTKDASSLTSLATLLDGFNSAEGVDLGLPNTTAGGKKK